jgi:hypothetical protein
VLAACAARRRVGGMDGFAEFSPALPSCVPPAFRPLGGGILQVPRGVIGRVDAIFDKFKVIAIKLRCVELVHRLELFSYI